MACWLLPNPATEQRSLITNKSVRARYLGGIGLLDLEKKGYALRLPALPCVALEHASRSTSLVTQTSKSLSKPSSRSYTHPCTANRWSRLHALCTTVVWLTFTTCSTTFSSQSRSCR